MKPYEEMSVKNYNAKDAMSLVMKIRSVALSSKKKCLQIIVPSMYESMSILGIAEFIMEPYGSIVWDLESNVFKVDFKSRLCKVEFIHSYDGIEWEEVNQDHITQFVRVAAADEQIEKMCKEYLDFMYKASSLGYSSCVFYLGYTDIPLYAIKNALNSLSMQFGRNIKIAYKNKFIKISWDQSEELPVLSDSNVSIYREVADILFGSGGIMYTYNKENEIINSSKVEYYHTDIKCKFKEAYDIKIAPALINAMMLIGYPAFDLSFENGKLVGVIFHFI